MREQNNSIKIFVSIFCILIGAYLLFQSNNYLSSIDEKVAAQNQDYTNKINSLKESNQKQEDELKTIDEKLALLNARTESLKNLVSTYDYESNKYDDYIARPINLDYNVQNIKNTEDFNEKSVQSYYFELQDAELTKLNLLFSSILQNDYLIKEINYNLLKSNIEAYKYNGLLNYYNNSNNYFVKSKLSIEPKDKLLSLYNNMLLLRNLGLGMLDHLDYTNNSDAKEIEYLQSKKQIKDIDLSKYDIPERYREEYYKKLTFGTDVYAVSNSSYLTQSELVGQSANVQVLKDMRGRIYLISEIDDSVLNYYYDSSGQVYRVIDISKNQILDFANDQSIKNRASELYNMSL